MNNKLKERLKVGGSKFVGSALSVVLAVGLMPLPAFASDLQASSIKAAAETVTAKSTEGHIIGAAHAAANPAPEILGLDNPAQRQDKEGQTTYTFFGDDEINSNPDPYLYNTVKNAGEPTWTSGAGSPVQALDPYDTSKGAAGYPNGIWVQKPHVVVATGKNTDDWTMYDTAKYARAAETANRWGAFTYRPLATVYNLSGLSTFTASMYRIAEAAELVMKGSDYKPGDYGITAASLGDYSYEDYYQAGVEGRYGDPLEIAKNYERYILGQKGAVLKAIADKKVQEKTIALVSSYDSTAKTYSIQTEGYSTGTETTNRYLETVQGVTKNLYDTYSGGTVTAAELNKADFIILSGEATSSGSIISALTADGLLSKAFYCSNWDAGSAFGTTHNSVENAQNVGRVLPCVYPEVLDQSDMIAYYYDVFYHIIASERSAFIGDQMDGVRNFNKTDSAAYTSWDASDVDDYNQANVQAILVSGIKYLNSNAASLKKAGKDYLVPTGYLASDSAKVSLTKATITVPAGILANGKAEPEPVVTYNGITLVKGTDYTVSYSNNTKANEKGIVTVTAVSGSDYSGGKSAEFTVLTGENFGQDKGSVTLSQASYTYTGNAIAPKPEVKNASATLMTEGTDYRLSYENNVNAGTAKVTAIGLGKYAGSLSADFTITKNTAPTLVCAAAPKGELTVTYKEKGLTALNPNTTSDGKLTFTSSNESVAKVDGNGNISTVAPNGSATLTVTAAETNNCAKKQITVKFKAAQGKQSVSVGAAANNVVTVPISDGTVNLKVAQSDEGGATTHGGALSYEVGDPDYATVADGVATLKKIGETSITVKAAANNYYSNEATSDVANRGSTTKVKLVITAGASTISLKDASVSYTGKAVAFPMANVKKTGSTGKVTFSYFSDAACLKPVAAANVKKAGTYYVKATVAAAGDYASATSAAAKLVVKKAASTISLASQTKTYTGKALAYSGKVTKAGSTGKVTYKYYSNAACTKAVAASNVKNAGTYYVKATVAADANYAAATSKAVAFKIGKANQTITAKKSVYKVKYKKKKNQKIAVAFTASGGGKCTWAKASSGKVSIAKNGKVTVKKGAAKKTYTLKVNVTAAASGNYAQTTVKQVVLKVKVA